MTGPRLLVIHNGRVRATVFWGNVCSTYYLEHLGTKLVCFCAAAGGFAALGGIDLRLALCAFTEEKRCGHVVDQRRPAHKRAETRRVANRAAWSSTARLVVYHSIAMVAFATGFGRVNNELRLGPCLNGSNRSWVKRRAECRRISN